MKYRQKYLDQLKGIGILLVVLGHTYGLPVYLKGLIYSFHMPLFFIISGYVYNKDKYNLFSFKEIVSFKAKAYLVPYIVYSIINLLLVVLWNLFFNGAYIGSDKIIHYIKGIIYCYANVKYMPNCSPLWFLMCLFISSIIFWLIQKYGNKYKVIIFPCLLFMSYGLYKVVHFRLPWNLATVGAATFFMGVGSYIHKWNRINNWPLIVLGIIGIIAGFLNGINVGLNENTYGNLLLFLLSSVGISLAVLMSCKRGIVKIPYLDWLGRNTLPIIAFNYFARDFSTELYYWIPILRKITLCWPVSFILTLTVLVLYIVMKNRVQNSIQFAVK